MLKFVEAEEKSSLPPVLEHLHQSLRNATRDELDSQVRYQLIQLLIDLIELEIISRETNEDITDRNIDELLHQSDSYLDEADTSDKQAIILESDGFNAEPSNSLINNLPVLSQLQPSVIKSLATLSPTSAKYHMHGQKKPVQFQLSGTYQLLKRFERSDPCPAIRKWV